MYDFDWWVGKEYVTDVIFSGGEKFCQVIEKIDEMVLEDGQTYQIWAPEEFFGDYIKTSLLEFTREVPIYNKENGTGLKEVGIDNRQKNTRPIRLKRNEIGGYDLQVKNSDGTWQNVK